MAIRLPNFQLIKSHRSYSVEEIARCLGVHRGTVRGWIKRGLPTTDRRRPILVLGAHLREHLEGRRARGKRPCQPGEIYCVRCRVPRRPAGGFADYEPSTPSLGSLIGICPDCDAFIYRRVNRAKLAEVKGDLEVNVPKAAER